MIIFFPALFGPALPRLKPKPPKAPKKHRKETPRARYQRQQAARALNQLWWYCAHCGGHEQADINLLCGVCDDCVAFGEDTIVLRAKVVFEHGQNS